MEFEKHETDTILAMDVIEQAQTEWSAPMVFVISNDGPLQFCADCLNCRAVGMRDSYPKSHVDECTDFFGNARISSTCDPHNGYWTLEFVDDHRNRTSIASHHGLFSYVQTTFGLKCTRDVSTQDGHHTILCNGTLHWSILMPSSNYQCLRTNLSNRYEKLEIY